MKNPETIIRGIMKEAAMTSSGVEGDYEGDMARGELQAIIANAQDLLNQIEEKTELEAWVQSKITKAADYISSVRNYMQGQQHRMQSSGVNEQKDAIVKAVAAHVGSKNPSKVKKHFAHDEKAAEEIVKLAKSMEEQVISEGKQNNQLNEACWKGYVADGMKNKNGKKVPNCVPVKEEITQLDEKSAAWQRKEGKDPEGGLNRKGVESYRRENPGSKLKTAVTTEPSKLKPGSKSAKRRKSFCARMKGMKARLTSAKTARDPDSRINKSLRKWNCE
jgi:hypothetical protein